VTFYDFFCNISNTNIKKLAKPKNIDITGDTMKEHVKNGMDWNFM